MASIGDAFRSFWHAMTSYDRHANHDTAYRINRSSTAGSGRTPTLSSVTSTRLDTDPLYGNEDTNRSTMALQTGNGYASSTGDSYVPGMMTAKTVAVNVDGVSDRPDSPGDVPLQNFSEGLPPAPPVSHSWKRIDGWAEEQYQELFDQLSEPATINDLNELEHELDCTLPMDVRESLLMHDGQERGGRPTGIIFGCMLLDCEEILQDWKQWKTVNDQYQLADRQHQEQPKAFGSSSSQAQAQGTNPHWRHDLLQKQDCVPPNAIQKAYAHPAWVPLARDWGGNNLAVDLAPGPAGKWGQIILFGRDYDVKYVVARSWAHFLAGVSDDLNSGKWYVQEDSGELKLREFKTDRVEPEYLDILRWRVDMKYGGARRRRPAPPPGGARLSSQSPTREHIRAPIPKHVNPGHHGRRTHSPSSPRFAPKQSPLSQVHKEIPPVQRINSDPSAAGPGRSDSGEVKRPLIAEPEEKSSPIAEPIKGVPVMDDVSLDESEKN